jgi:hypothetical protein
VNTISFLIAFAPLLLLLASLLANRYPGERVIGALRQIFGGSPRRRTPGAGGLDNPLDLRHPPRGGALIGDSLAGRAPPVPA